MLKQHSLGESNGVSDDNPNSIQKRKICNFLFIVSGSHLSLKIFVIKHQWGPNSAVCACDTTLHCWGFIIIPLCHYVKCSQMVAQTGFSMPGCICMSVYVSAEKGKICLQGFCNRKGILRCAGIRQRSPLLQIITPAGLVPSCSSENKTLFILLQTGGIKGGDREACEMIHGHSIWMTSWF